jgi:hypothetical protein
MGVLCKLQKRNETLVKVHSGQEEFTKKYANDVLQNSGITTIRTEMF